MLALTVGGLILYSVLAVAVIWGSVGFARDQSDKDGSNIVVNFFGGVFVFLLLIAVLRGIWWLLMKIIELLQTQIF
jgi:hypothetical protein